MSLIEELHQQRKARLLRLGTIPAKPYATKEQPKTEAVKEWVGRQKQIPLPKQPSPNKPWFSIVEDCGPITHRHPEILDILRIVAFHFNVTRTDILSHRQTVNFSLPRQVAMYLCRRLTLRSTTEIGRKMGGRDHTTILHGAKKIERLLTTDPILAEQVYALEAKIGGVA